MMWELANNLNPFEKAWSLRRQMERLLDGLDVGREPYPAVNAWSNHDEVVVTAEIPGTPRDKVEISVAGDLLSLEGAKEEERPGRGRGVPPPGARPGRLRAQTAPALRGRELQGQGDLRQRGADHHPAPRREDQTPENRHQLRVSKGGHIMENIKNASLEKHQAELTRDIPVFTPSADIYELGDKLHIVCDLPGVGEKDLDITLEDSC